MLLSVLAMLQCRAAGTAPVPHRATACPPPCATRPHAHTLHALQPCRPTLRLKDFQPHRGCYQNSRSQHPIPHLHGVLQLQAGKDAAAGRPVAGRGVQIRGKQPLTGQHMPIVPLQLRQPCTEVSMTAVPFTDASDWAHRWTIR